MTAKQKANRERFKKVVAEAKKLRKKNPKLTQAQAVKQAWAIMYGKGKKVAGYSKERTTIHKRATKWAKNIKGKNPDLDKKSVLARAYEHAGYGPPQKVGAVKKKAVKKKTAKKSSSYHKDTKSHNVNIRVISGIGNIGEKFTRINNDINGNPRYVIHFLEILNDEEKTSIPFNKKYQYAVKKANKIGGKKYDNKSYGGGIVFQSYNIEETYKAIQKIKNSTPKIKI